MKKLIIILIACIFLYSSGSASARSITKGPNNRGVKFSYEGFPVGPYGVVRFDLECVKNWGGETGGVAEVIAWYVDGSGLEKKSVVANCHVSGGLDGARHWSKGDAKTITIPVPLKDANIRAYIAYTDVSNLNDFTAHLSGEINKAVDKVSAGLVKHPLKLGQTLQQAVAPTGGDKLSFNN